MRRTATLRSPASTGTSRGAAGATDVVLHIGTNDIAAGAGAGAIVTGMQEFAERTRASGRRVFLTTITPSTDGPHGTPRRHRHPRKR